MKKIFSILLMAAIVLSMAACGSTIDSTSNTDQNDSPEVSADNSASGTTADTASEGSGIIGMSHTTLANEFFINFDSQFHGAFESAGYEVISVSAEMNAATQVSDIENLTAMNCEAIFLFMTDPEAVSDAMLKARETGIKIYILAGAPSNRDAFDYSLGTDQYGTGTSTAELTAKWIEETFPDAEDRSIEVALVTNTQGEQMVQRLDGMKTIEDICSKAKIVEIYDTIGATSENAKAQEYSELMQVQYPNLKVVMAYGCDVALGVNEVFMKDTSLNRSEFAVFSVDTSETMFTAIQNSINNESLIRATVCLGRDLGMDCLNSYTGVYEATDDGYIYLPSEVVTIDNIGDFIN